MFFFKSIWHKILKKFAKVDILALSHYRSIPILKRIRIESQYVYIELKKSQLIKIK